MTDAKCCLNSWHDLLKVRNVEAFASKWITDGTVLAGDAAIARKREKHDKYVVIWQ